jgi:hypothetical protein
VANTLIRHIIPSFGLPQSLQSDNGPAFISKVTQLVCEHLAITCRLHTPYHPQSSGKVERANGLIKQQLTKLSLELRLSWVDLLPLALTRLRAAPRQPTGLSPFELLYSSPFLLSHTFPSNTPPLTGYLPYFTLLHSLLQAHADHYLSQSDTLPPDHGPIFRLPHSSQAATSKAPPTQMDGTIHCHHHPSFSGEAPGTPCLKPPHWP